MRIMQVNSFYTAIVGGATILADGISRSLMSDNEVSVFAGEIDLKRPLHTMRDVDAGGVPVRLVNLYGLFDMNLDASIDGFNEKNYLNPDMGRIFREYLEDIRPDIVHFHSLQWLGANLLEEAVKAGARTVVTMHDWWWICTRQFLFGPDRRLCPIMEEPSSCYCKDDARYNKRAGYLNDVLKKADKVLTPSALMKRSFQERRPLGLDVRVVENGVEKPAGRIRTPATEGGVVFGYLGGDNMLKGVDMVKDAVILLGNKYGAGRFSVKMYGFALHRGLLGNFLSDRNIMMPTRNPAVRALRKFRSKLAVYRNPGASGWFSFYPFFTHDRLDEVLGGLDVLLIPSLMRESYSLVTREALIRGIPVIATDSGGPQEAITDGVNGFICRTNEPSSLAEKMSKFIEDPGLAARMSRDIDTSSVRLFEDYVEELRGIYKELAA
jgi:glycosyltransferase involved in cell wall biosynthesis